MNGWLALAVFVVVFVLAFAILYKAGDGMDDYYGY